MSTAKQFKSCVNVEKGEKTANGKSIVSLLCADIGKNSEILIRCDGEDEQEALKALLHLAENQFGE
mgnify:FL=1